LKNLVDKKKTAKMTRKINSDYRKLPFRRHRWSNEDLTAICEFYIYDSDDFSKDTLIRKIQDWFRAYNNVSMPSRGAILRKLQDCADLQRNDWMRWRRPVRSSDGSIVLVVIWNEVKNRYI
jgi:hypothetical protein